MMGDGPAFARTILLILAIVLGRLRNLSDFERPIDLLHMPNVYAKFLPSNREAHELQPFISDVQRRVFIHTHFS